MKTLIPMVDFVLERRATLDVNFCGLKTYSNKIDEIFNYARFLKKPLQLGMFVPCDLEGNVLEEPEMDMFFTATTDRKARL